MGEQWPSLRGRQMRQILTRLCGEPERQEGSHAQYLSPETGRRFTYGYHDNREIRGSIVRRILMLDVGLSERQARKEAR